MATITYEAIRHKADASDNTRPVVLALDGVLFRVDHKYPATEPQTRVAVEAWFGANISTGQIDRWAAQAVANAADEVEVAIPDRWRRRRLSEGDLTRDCRALMRQIVVQLNDLRTDPNTVKAAITSTDILTGMRADINSTA